MPKPKTSPATDEEIAKLRQDIATYWANHPERVVAPAMSMILRIEADRARIAELEDEVRFAVADREMSFMNLTATIAKQADRIAELEAPLKTHATAVDALADLEGVELSDDEESPEPELSEEEAEAFEELLRLGRNIRARALKPEPESR